MTHPKRKPVTAARIKAAAVRDNVHQAEVRLHVANEALAQTVVGSVAVATNETVRAALEENVRVEAQLHDAVKELQVVTELLKTAEADRASVASNAGRRSGEGVDSVLEHIAAARS